MKSVEQSPGGGQGKIRVSILIVTSERMHRRIVGGRGRRWKVVPEASSTITCFAKNKNLGVGVQESLTYEWLSRMVFKRDSNGMESTPQRVVVYGSNGFFGRVIVDESTLYAPATKGSRKCARTFDFFCGLHDRVAGCSATAVICPTFPSPR
jgi:hypothetical protein